ncbi:WD40 repeat-like protein, partial [Piedraia hortae CBS 480.64]
ITMKTTFTPIQTLTPFYTGGAISLSYPLLASTLHSSAVLTHLPTNKQITTLPGDDEPLTCLTLSPNARYLVTASRSLSLNIYTLAEGIAESIADGVVEAGVPPGGLPGGLPNSLAGPPRTLKPHSTPSVSLTINPSSTHLATGSASGEIRILNLSAGFATHTFHLSGVITTLRFLNSKNLAAGTDSGVVGIFDLTSNRVVKFEAHASVVRAIGYLGGTVLTASRDRTVAFWTLQGKEVKRVAVLESIEAADFLSDGKFYTAGEGGRLRLWDFKTSEEVAGEKDPGEPVVDVLVQGEGRLVSVRDDQTLLIHDTTTLGLDVVRRVSGSFDAIYDLVFVGPSRLALATSSSSVRIVGLEKGDDLGVLAGHIDVVLSLAVDASGKWLLTGSKDTAIKLWDVETSTCKATFTGHTESVTAVAIPPSDQPKHFLSASSDRTIKKWSLTAQKAIYTRKAHNDEINALAIQPHRFASASKDKTIKLFDFETGEVLALLRGHTRGVWSVAFSPKGTSLPIPGGTVATNLLASSSSDFTLKLWDLRTYECVASLEGHAAAIYKTLWLPPGEASQPTLLATAAADGLVKIWNAATQECVATLDNHTDRVWGLAIQGSDEPTILASGSADASFTLWRDTSSATATEALEATSRRVEEDQELQNQLREGLLREAADLALRLDHPRRLLEIFGRLVEGGREGEIRAIVRGLDDGLLVGLLRRVRDWNANGWMGGVAQWVLHAVLVEVGAERLVRLKGGKELWDGLAAYTKRYVDAAKKREEEGEVLRWVLGQMGGVEGVI